LLPKLIRIVFFGNQITNEGYLARYQDYWKRRFPGKDRKEFSQKAAADRKFLGELEKLTWKMMVDVLRAMGYEVDSVQITLHDRLAGTTTVFSTADSLEELRAKVAEHEKVGIDSI
jgi:hypothetical protein